MSILLKKAGILTTVQDLGRTGFQRFGINPNGAMDRTATRLRNVLLGNDENEAVLETHFPAPQILFEEDAVFALCGADFGAKIGERKIENWRPYFVYKGDILSFNGKFSGNRAYLAVKGGFKTEKWLGSASTNLKAGIGGFEGRKLGENDRIFFNQITKRKGQKANYKISFSLIPFYSSSPTVRVTKGAEFEDLTKPSKETFVLEDYKIRHESDRMGFRLEGAGLVFRQKQELLSSAVNFGTIQLLPNNQLIILMADHQTSGGYPRIAHLIENDLPLVAQLGANDKIAFEIISNEEAENLKIEFENELNWLKVGVRQK
ncbi:MAG TPA: biotin-dependent carboxyltransferase family protein [Pyrinomonadaceae bacterium]|nr:biotin-dependent carboxyltransferase family protein [Pyrinomonadaceae bacterium]